VNKNEAAERAKVERFLREIFRRDKTAGLIGHKSASDIAEAVKQNTGILSPELMRRAVLGGIEVKKDKYETSDNVVVMGCFCFGILLTVRSFCLILNRLGEDYAFLKREYCCGAPLFTQLLVDGEDVGKADPFVLEFVGKNVSRAREQEAKNMIYFCIWCSVLGKRFFSGGDINQLFFGDFLADRLKDVKLSLKGRVGYYRGCLRQTALYLGGDPNPASSGLNWTGYRDLLNRIEGLEVVDLPDNLCCKANRESIFKKAKREGLDTIVCFCNDCYGQLQRSAPEGMQVKFLSDILLDAMGGHSR